MDGFIRQSTALTVPIGPLVDAAGAKIEGASLTQAKVILSKHNSTTFAQKSDATSCTHRSNGVYTCPLDTTDTNTLGMLNLQVEDTGALILRHTYMVLAQNSWDSLFGSDRLFVDVMEINSSTAAASKAAISFDLMLQGAVVADGSNSATSFKTDLTSSTNDQVINRLIYFRATAAAVGGQAFKIGDYDGTTKFITAANPEQLSTTPTAGDPFIIL